MILKNNKLILDKVLKVILGDYDIPSLGSRKVSIILRYWTTNGLINSKII